MSSFIVNADGWPVIDKDPDAVLDYTVDWTAWLADVSDSISDHTETGNGVTVDTSSNTSNTVTAWVSGGVVGQTPSVTVHIVTAGGRQDDRTIYFNIKER
jgi:hypothetical protein